MKMIIRMKIMSPVTARRLFLEVMPESESRKNRMG